MLTKEEANEIYKELGMIYMYCADCPGCLNAREVWEKIASKLKRLTEKPKREIQIGDIYLDGEGRANYIIEIKEGVIIAVELDAQKLRDGNKYDYDMRGNFRPLIGWPNLNPSANLDLSKRYELIEVKDATM